jgi:hypothetical protein
VDKYYCSKKLRKTKEMFKLETYSPAVLSLKFREPA